MDEFEKTIKDIDSIGRSKDTKVELVKQGYEICFDDNKTNDIRKDGHRENSKEKQMELTQLKNNIEQWSKDRGLDTADSSRQFLKLIEEVGELASAMARNQEDLIKDSVGDTFVVLTVLCQQLGISFEESVELAWDEIKDRKGKMINGVFVKEEDLR